MFHLPARISCQELCCFCTRIFWRKPKYQWCRQLMHTMLWSASTEKPLSVHWYVNSFFVVVVVSLVENFFFFYHSVPQMCPPPPLFAFLALVQNARGAYTRDGTFYLANTHPFRCHLNDLIVGGGWGPSTRCCQGKEMLPTLSVCWQASGLRGKDIAGVSIIDAGGQYSW